METFILPHITGQGLQDVNVTEMVKEAIWFLGIEYSDGVAGWYRLSTVEIYETDWNGMAIDRFSIVQKLTIISVGCLELRIAAVLEPATMSPHGAGLLGLAGAHRKNCRKPDFDFFISGSTGA